MSELVGCTELQALSDRGALGDGSGPSACLVVNLPCSRSLHFMQATTGKQSSGSGMHRASRQSLLASPWHPQPQAAVGLPKRQTPPQAAGSTQDLWILAGSRCASARLCWYLVHAGFWLFVQCMLPVHKCNFQCSGNLTSNPVLTAE